MTNFILWKLIHLRISTVFAVIIRHHSWLQRYEVGVESIIVIFGYFSSKDYIICWQKKLSGTGITTLWSRHWEYYSYFWLLFVKRLYYLLTKKIVKYVLRLRSLKILKNTKNTCVLFTVLSNLDYIIQIFV